MCCRTCYSCVILLYFDNLPIKLCYPIFECVSCFWDTLHFIRISSVSSTISQSYRPQGTKREQKQVEVAPNQGSLPTLSISKETGPGWTDFPHGTCPEFSYCVGLPVSRPTHLSLLNVLSTFSPASSVLLLFETLERPSRWFGGIC